MGLLHSALDHWSKGVVRQLSWPLQTIVAVMLCEQMAPTVCKGLKFWQCEALSFCFMLEKCQGKFTPKTVSLIICIITKAGTTRWMDKNCAAYIQQKKKNELLKHAATWIISKALYRLE